MTNKNGGLVAALGAFTLWGLLPLYWKALASALPLEILCHRIGWSAPLTLLLLILWKKAGRLRTVARQKKVLLRFILTSLLLSVNWLTYIWAVNSGYIVESSLGYFINPLVNVLLGLLFLKERLCFLQWLAVFLAFLGVCYLTFGYGRFPWIAMVLAGSFGFYGLLRKTTSLSSLEGLFLETSILFLPAIFVLLFLAVQGESDFIRQNFNGRLLLAGTGVVTTMPLLLFGFAAQRIQLSTLGIVQYLAPTLQLCIGIFVYREPFPPEQLLGFSLVWCALVLYGIEGALRSLRMRKARLDSPS